jgi:hypothetical protein
VLLVRRPWVWVPVWQMRLPEGRLLPRPAATAHRLRVASTLNRADPADRVDRVDQVVLAPVDPAARADLRNTQADQAVLLVGPVDLVVPVDPGNTQAVPVVPADPVDLGSTPANTDPVAQVAPVDRAVLGTATTNAATSVAPRGATGLAPGVMVRLLVRPGIDRCRRQEARGTTARSTTTATRRRPSGIPALTSLASTSSECGSRCNKPPTTPASPHGEAGVVGLTRQQNPMAFSHGAAIMTWVLMNVRNPDLSLLTSKPLPNVGHVVVTRNPAGGWTLAEWDTVLPPC